ncbi:hypothetical protein DRN94_001075 [archaeon]|nr:hypothetical protein [archaeon]
MIGTIKYQYVTVLWLATSLLTTISVLIPLRTITTVVCYQQGVEIVNTVCLTLNVCYQYQLNASLVLSSDPLVDTGVLVIKSYTVILTGKQHTISGFHIARVSKTLYVPIASEVVIQVMFIQDSLRVTYRSVG